MSNEALCFALLLALTSPTAASTAADHPYGSPLNPVSSDDWVNIGRLDPDPTTPAGDVYANVSDMAVGDPDSQGNFEAKYWIIFDTPMPWRGKSAIEYSERAYVNCTARALAVRYLILWAAHGQYLDSSDDTANKNRVFEPTKHGTVAEMVVNRFCSK